MLFLLLFPPAIVLGVCIEHGAAWYWTVLATAAWPTFVLGGDG